MPNRFKTYREKLRDPRWQRRRLEILQRDDFKCRRCEDASSPLNVHHLYYENRDPWDYPDDSLATLCESCHEHESVARKQLEVALLDLLRRIGASADHIDALCRLISDRQLDGLELAMTVLEYDDYYKLAAEAQSPTGVRI